MKVYIVQWGYHSCLDGAQELKSIWTTREGAIKAVKRDIGHRKLDKNLTYDYWSDGDYWISVSEVNIDKDSLYGDE